MKRALVIAVALAAAISAGWAETPARANAEQELARAAAQGEYTFLVFYKDNGAATQSLVKALDGALAGSGRQATIAYAQATHPSQQALVKRFGVARAPMPLVVAVAPNGAVTGVFPRTISDKQVAGAFVSPKMAQCMKSMQAGRLVLVCVGAGAGEPMSTAVEEFRSDPQFSARTDVVTFDVDDPAEAEFLQQLKIDGAAPLPTTALLAPPAVLVGKFGPGASSGEMAAALHAAGKCCNDPNCKHNHAHK